MDSTLPVIDLDLGAKILGADKNSAKKMINDLAAMLVGNLKELKQVYQQGDLKKIADLAHFIHGGSCYCGTPRLKAASKELEIQAKKNEQLEELKSAYESLCNEIQAVISQSDLT
ncbi:MAG: Hpt domain-containing protein [Proteobacteria bacterium]|nr:Hpt domain-containing protein [Pseudomonadota bacterium]